MILLEFLLFLLVIALMASVGVLAAITVSSRPTLRKKISNKDDPPDEPSPKELGDYYKGRTDIVVDSAGYYEGEDDENMAAMVRAAFLSGGMVVGNVNDAGDLEVSVHPVKDKKG